MDSYFKHRLVKYISYTLVQLLGVMQIFERLVSCCPNLLKIALERKVNRLVSTLTRLGHATGYVATGQTRAGSRSNQQRAQPEHRRSLQFLRHVRLHVAIRHCVVTHLAAIFWFFGSFFRLMQPLVGNYTSGCVFGTRGILQVGVDRNAAGRGAQESPAYH